jgi:hypothetical protein
MSRPKIVLCCSLVMILAGCGGTDDDAAVAGTGQGQGLDLDQIKERLEAAGLECGEPTEVADADTGLGVAPLAEVECELDGASVQALAHEGPAEVLATRNVYGQVACAFEPEAAWIQGPNWSVSASTEDSPYDPEATATVGAALGVEPTIIRC